MKLTDYAYSVGRVRALEKRLLKTVQFRSLIEAPEVKEALDAISEHQDYSEQISRADNFYAAENLLESSLLASGRLARKLLFTEEIFPEGTSSAFLRRYFKAGQELQAIKGFIREKLSAGELNSYNFLEHYERSGYVDIIRRGLEHYRRHRSFVLLEKLGDDFLMRCLRPAKYISFGPEPVWAWYLARQNEIKMLKMIVAGKFFNIDKEILTTRLNLSYV